MDVIEIERKILTTYRKDIYRPFTRAIMDYELLKENDHICVCISGGKDSLTLAKCMQEIERHGKIKIKCEYIVMNPGFSKKYINIVKNNTKKMGIPIQIIDSDIFTCVKNANHKSPCYICAKMRRGFLYDTAKKMGCNKIALGHHFDDVIETTMLSILYSGVYNTMLPKLNSENYEGMQLIRPLYLVKEKAIDSYIRRCEISPEKCNCPLKNEDSKRKEIKELIKQLNKKNKFISYNIFRSSENVCLDSVRGYIKDKEKVDFCEYFDKYL